MAGNYFSETITTSTTDYELITKLKTDLNVKDSFVIKKMTLITTANIHLSVNHSATSTLFLNADGNYCLSLDYDDVNITSLVCSESGVAIFIALIWN